MLRKQFKQERKSIINALSQDEKRGPMLSSCESDAFSKLELSLMDSESEVWLSSIQGRDASAEIIETK